MQERNDRIITYLLKNRDYIDRDKLMNFISAIKSDWSKSDSTLSAPLWVGWKITPRCNITCKHCWAHLGGNQRSYEDLKKVTDKLAEAKVLHITLTGGEPMIRKDFFKLLSYIKSKNIHVEIFTNGWFITKEKSKLLKEILDISNDVIQISLDGAKPQTHDAQRMKGSYDRVIRALENLSEFSLKTRLNFTATHLNVHEIFETYKLSQKLKVSIFSVSPVYPSDRGANIASLLNEEEYFEQIEKCIDYRNQNTNAVQFRPFLPISLFNNNSSDYDKFNISEKQMINKIEEGDIYWSIDSRGDVYPSIDLYHRELCGGNIYIDTVQDIQKNFSYKYDRFRNLSNKKCNKCKFYQLCGGGDLGFTYSEYNTFNEVDPTCIKEVL